MIKERSYAYTYLYEKLREANERIEELEKQLAEIRETENTDVSLSGSHL